MKSKVWTKMVYGFILLLVLFVPRNTPAQMKGRIAVLDFDDTDVRSAAYAIHRRPLGNWIAGLVIDDLLERKRSNSLRGTTKKFQYILIERSRVSKILQEHRFSSTSSFNRSDQERIGNLLGADGLILGTVTDYRPTQKTAKLSFVEQVAHDAACRANTSLGRQTPCADEVKINSTAFVHLNVRLVSTKTGEIISSAEVREKEDKSEKVAANNAYPNPERLAPLFEVAVNRAVLGISHQLLGLPKLQSIVVAKKLSEKKLIISAGKDRGVMKGDRFKIRRNLGLVIHPISQEGLGVAFEDLGEFEVVDVFEKYSVGRYKSKSHKKVVVGNVATPL